MVLLRLIKFGMYISILVAGLLFFFTDYDCSFVFDRPTETHPLRMKALIPTIVFVILHILLIIFKGE